MAKYPEPFRPNVDFVDVKILSRPEYWEGNEEKKGSWFCTVSAFNAERRWYFFGQTKAAMEAAGVQDGDVISVKQMAKYVVEFVHNGINYVDSDFRNDPAGNPPTGDSRPQPQQHPVNRQVPQVNRQPVRQAPGSQTAYNFTGLMDQCLNAVKKLGLDCHEAEATVASAIFNAYVAKGLIGPITTTKQPAPVEDDNILPF